jgi:hypothetical protein
LYPPREADDSVDGPEEGAALDGAAVFALGSDGGVVLSLLDAADCWDGAADAVKPFGLLTLAAFDFAA